MTPVRWGTQAGAMTWLHSADATEMICHLYSEQPGCHYYAEWIPTRGWGVYRSEGEQRDWLQHRRFRGEAQVRW